MLLENFRRLLQFLALLALQVLLMNHIHVMGYGSVLVYVALLLYFPLGSSRIGTLLWAFALGFAVDMFSNTPGVSSASLTFAAMFQPGLLRTFTPKEALDDMTPNYKSMGFWNHLRYLSILLILHHVVYFALESFTYFNLKDLGMSCGISFLLSWVCIVALETLRRHE